MQFQRTDMRTKYIRFLLTALLFLPVFWTSCQKEDLFTPDVQSLIGGTWQLTEFVNTGTNKSQVVSLPAGSDSYQITFRKDSTWFGTSSSNHLSGKYSIVGARRLIKLSEITTTRMPESGYGNQYIQSLSEVSEYEVTDKELRLYYTKEKYLRYLPYPPVVSK